MTILQDILNTRKGSVIDIEPNATVEAALAKMALHNVGSLVVREAGRLVGILTERHFVRNVYLRGLKSPDRTVSQVMEREVIVGQPEDSVEACLALMARRGFRHLPVVSGEEVVGLVTMTDLVGSIVGEQAFTIGQLEKYIRGT